MSGFKSRFTMAATAASVVLTMVIAGCGDDKDCPVCSDAGASKTPPPTPVAEAALVLGGDTAWVDTGYAVGNRDGFVFKADGTFGTVTDAESSGDETVWDVSQNAGSVSAKDGALVVISGWLYFGLEPGMEATYAVSGNTLVLTIGKTKVTFVKTPGVVVSEEDDDDDAPPPSAVKARRFMKAK